MDELPFRGSPSLGTSLAISNRRLVRPDETAAPNGAGGVTILEDVTVYPIITPAVGDGANSACEKPAT